MNTPIASRAFAYTDGVTEAMNEARTLYDEPWQARLLGAIESDQARDSAQADGITMLPMVVLGKPGDTLARVLELFLANRPEEIGRANEAFDAFAESEKLSAPIRRSISVVIDELLNNVISYAFPDDGAHELEVRLELSRDQLSITITDDGVPFNPFADSPPNTSLSVEDKEIGGLGIHLVRNMMDEATYNRSDDRNVVILVKYLP